MPQRAGVNLGIMEASKTVSGGKRFLLVLATHSSLIPIYDLRVTNTPPAQGVLGPELVRTLWWQET